MKLNASHKKALGIIVLLVFINLVATQFFKRIDFTSDGRYTLAESSRDLVETIDKPLLVKVFLTGDLPSEFNRLQTEARYILEEFKAYNSNIKFEFVDPLEGDKDAMEVANQFYGNEMSPESLNIRENGKLTERLIFPWAIADYGGKQVPIQLLQKNTHAKQF